MSSPEPPLRPLRWRLFHWGPIVAMSIVATIAITTIYCHLQWWPPEKSFAAVLDIIVFLIWNYLTLSNLMQASYIGPGYVPFGWKPEKSEDEQLLQQCEPCGGFKAPRSHHCRQCGRCVMKMDHHCPWINNCCGHLNHGYFTAFLISAVIGCIHAVCVLLPSLYWAIFRVWYMIYGTGREPRVELGLYGLFATIFAFGLAFGVIIAVGFLFCIQLRSILRNRTGLEDYIVAKANARDREEPFVYPYDLGWKENFKQVVTWDLRPRGDGIVWPVRDGCDQYTLTREQLEQKRLKRLMAIDCKVVKPYRGEYWISRDRGGCSAICSQPIPWPCLPDEAIRLHLEVDDRVLVTGFRRHWLYGTKQFTEQMQYGWFPRKCVVEMEESENGDANQSNDATQENGVDENANAQEQPPEADHDANANPVGHQKVE